jgi:hypothetical protein
MTIRSLQADLSGPAGGRHTTGVITTMLLIGLMATGASAQGVEIIVGDLPIAGRDFEVVARVTGLQVDEAQIYYRITGETGPYQSVVPERSGNRYTVRLPADKITPRGLDVHAWFRDGDRITTHPAENPAESPERIPVLVIRYDWPHRLSPGVYRMVSFPVNLDAGGLRHVLEDDLGPYESGIWRLFSWNGTRYVELPDLNAEFRPGKAYWIVSRFGGTIDAWSGRSVDPSEPYPIPLAPGWNQVANPFAFNVAWAAVGGSELVGRPVIYDGVEFIYDQTLLVPHEGYFVFNPRPDSVTLRVAPVEAAAGGNLGAEPSEYSLRFTARADGGRLMNSQTRVGFAASGPRTTLIAPSPGDHLRVGVLRDGIAYRSVYEDAGSGAAWDLEFETVRSGVSQPDGIQVTLVEEGSLPVGFELFVLDRDRGAPVRVVNGAFEVPPVPGHIVRKLTVLVGTRAFAEQHRDEIPLDATALAMNAVYPNPFSTRATIAYTLASRGMATLDVYDVVGRRVAVLSEGVQPAGPHRLYWDGTASGRPLPGGLYLISLRTAEGHVTRALTLVNVRSE